MSTLVAACSSLGLISAAPAMAAASGTLVIDPRDRRDREPASGPFSVFNGSDSTASYIGDRTEHTAPSSEERSGGLRLLAGLARPKKQAQFSVRLDTDLMARLDRIVAYGEWVGDPTITRSEITRKALTVFVEHFEDAAPGIEEMPLPGN